MTCDNLKTILKGEDQCFSNACSAIENGKKFILRNPSNKTVCRVRVDDCLITDKTIKKCDYLFQVSGSKFYLVELKGKSIDDAVAQILSTYDNVNKKIKAPASDYSGIVVSSAVPKAADQKFKNIQEKIYRDKKLMIKRKQFHYEEIV
ncbi:hypothetical protein H8S90_15155 [Olivibacter sp. SDN3]|uniref:hypothetical protein n=1 Tax=Olivibacter sp. SDN3 TaxID=2764720 RepID=UPI001650E7F1|nr:hypothetical protein [Olivibacter sp. SDN3]QNL48140.1 hypothetical protein H8S90_15155 [Olivibacter sp. SDN3]